MGHEKLVNMVRQEICKWRMENGGWRMVNGAQDMSIAMGRAAVGGG
jgi:hypothetical protein